ncbi:MAG: undecaprenyldiphospho-muramoylpentapeptide beta-N-acetylglucosaminyltransferase [Saprospiraceae bacterium]
MKVIVSGGGTGGHIFPAIAVAQELKRKVADVDILFVGALGKMEMEKVPKEGFEIKGLWISGLQRSLTIKNLLFPVKLIWSLIKAYSIINKFKPDVVASFGGYASGPIGQIAAWKHIPLILQEQNSYPGITNKILASKAKKICVAYDGMEKFFEKDKIVYTGNPVRKNIAEPIENINSSFRYFDMAQNKKTVLIFGGSLGARALNDAVKANIETILGSGNDVQVIWQVGKLYYDEIIKSDIANHENVKILPFIDRMDLAYSIADLVVARAGALTISELSLCGKAAILAPSPNVAEDHQTENALNLVEKNAALMIKDSELNENLGTLINSTIGNSDLLKSLENNILKLGRKNASEDIANILISVS